MAFDLSKITNPTSLGVVMICVAAWLRQLLAESDDGVRRIVVCCALPLFLAAAISLGVGAWLAAHGLRLLGGGTVLAAGATLFAVLRGRRTVACAMPAERVDAACVTRQPQRRDVGRS